MNKIRTAVAALVIAAGAFGAYAFSNANNSENEKVEFLNTYHYVGLDSEGRIEFASGPSTDPNCQPTGNVPCEFESTSSLTSPMTRDEIEAAADVKKWRP